MPDDDALDARVDEDEAILVHKANITGVHPELAVAVAADDICGLGLILVITQHHCWTADTDFSFFTKSKFLTCFGIKNRNNRVDHRNADAAGFVDVAHTGTRHGAQLGHAITFCEGIFAAV